MDDEVIMLTGLGEVEAFLNEAPTVIAAAAYRKALHAGIDVFAGGLEATTPVRKGNLKAALTTEVTVNANGTGGSARVGFGNLSHRALWVEYGHRMLSHKPGKKQLGSVPATPFMRPTFDSHADTAIEAVAESLSSSMNDEYRQETE